jgi:hypothetical protein
LTVTDTEPTQKGNRKSVQHLTINREICPGEKSKAKSKLVIRIWVHIGNNKGKGIRFDEESTEFLYTTDLDTCTVLINLVNPQFHWGTQKRLTFSEFDEISPFCESSKG